MSRRALSAALATSVLTVAGCSAAGDVTGTGPASATLRIGLVEWQIVTSGPALTAGPDQLIVTNTGTTAHDLHAAGPGWHVHTPLLAPGATATLVLTSRAGSTVTLTCEVPGHEAAGMHAELTVAASGG